MSNEQLPFGDLVKNKTENSPKNVQKKSAPVVTEDNRWGSLLTKKTVKPDVPVVKKESNIENPNEEIKETVYSVSDINSLIKKQIEGAFSSIWIQGEISNFKAHTSGHHYFSLKDQKCQVNAVMFKGFNSKLKFTPESGMEVLVRGKVTVYEPRGNYQIFCEHMEPVGAGALQKAFEQLKEKLHKEGLFNPEAKKALPLLPKHIGVVTSPTGAAIQDILNVLDRRYKGAQVTVIPARVQGDGAAQEVADGIKLANALDIFDVLIVGRGGGSIEDLWCFNEEIVARSIFASKIPIISAVGHEIDYTIADFVADYRAPTPSAGAEVVVKSVAELNERINNFKTRLSQSMDHEIGRSSQKVNHLQKRLVDPKRYLENLTIQCDEFFQRLHNGLLRNFKEKGLQAKFLREKLRRPDTLIQIKKEKLCNLKSSLDKAIISKCSDQKNQMSRLMSVLNTLSPLAVVDRGYALIMKDKKIIKSQDNVSLGDPLQIQLSDGSLEVEVTKKEDEWILKKN